MCIVMNLITQEKQAYTCEPREAVIAAYAQSMGDFNTWEYEEKYGKLLIKVGSYTFMCGDFSVFQDGRNLLL
jgi:hypothetical protein